MRIVREKARIRKHHQPREQHAAAPLEPEFAPGEGSGEGCAQAHARVHGLHSVRQNNQGCLTSRRPAKEPD
jgi:hypothetical protein